MPRKRHDTNEVGFTTSGTTRRLTPIDIQQKEFRLAFRGYNERDVDASAVENRNTADEVPVPIAMSAAEIDERAQAIEALGQTPATLSPKRARPLSPDRNPADRIRLR